MSEIIVIKRQANTSKYQYYRYFNLLKKMMADENKKTVDNLFNIQFSSLITNNDINEKQIKILYRLLCREAVDSLLQSTWFLRKKYCSVPLTKDNINAVVNLADKYQSNISDINWNALNAKINISDHTRFIQAIIKPIFIWWVEHITPHIFTLYEIKKDLEYQINQCENIKLFEEKEPSNIAYSFLSLEDIKTKLEADKARIVVIDDLLKKDIKLIIESWEKEPVFNKKINNTLAYLRNTQPHSELLQPLWDILMTIPQQPENCKKLKNWLVEHSLCLINDEFMWHL
ncbi:T3SS regulon anti-activator ExsD domain-containing protein [Proteus mirabilis]|uniref:T3SS regulon anti-activator ExsD domain-containing protein n=1 Tax=Proteus mirabilis TaxID=584 RepID=UPI0012BB6F8D|nr:T3SS regulon anti-activator ExsD domain-containing protein [Proteus mirabilis]NAC32867.1 T3SS regulon anti-activator ExsD family protein [Escherichia coli]MTS88214.1 T3SS regulon anti-activator ExsD family protein [Proteus mirabilis]MTS99369.1 T3SS regulon anti-activator ExsD family protein [Proteus mirabilis]MTT05682.1 T3SS regulon anti-activator ExsD family protein [Proteus mirabilis]MTT46505.1 T3SS regulon anti-activator ExsD family protein [Proteus mirabilis]